MNHSFIHSFIQATSPGIFYLKNAIRKNMPSRVANQVGGDFHWQHSTFDNPGHLRVKLLLVNVFSAGLLGMSWHKMKF